MNGRKYLVQVYSADGGRRGITIYQRAVLLIFGFDLGGGTAVACVGCFRRFAMLYSLGVVFLFSLGNGTMGCGL